MTTIAKALRYLTDFMDGEDEDGARKCAEILEQLSNGPRQKPSEDGYLNGVLAAAWAGATGPKPKLFVDARGGEAIVKLRARDGEVECRQPLEGGVLTTETLREAASRGIRVLVDRIRKRTGGDR